jgi:hypothetical protein
MIGSGCFAGGSAIGLSVTGAYDVDTADNTSSRCRNKRMRGFAKDQAGFTNRTPTR